MNSGRRTSKKKRAWEGRKALLISRVVASNWPHSRVHILQYTKQTMDGPRGGNVPPPFLTKTYDMVDDPETDMIVSWSSDNNSFVVWNASEFARDLLPKYFKHNNFSSFVRQLNTYGFRKVDPDRWEFANEIFLRGQRDLLKNIHRRKPSSSTHVHSQQQAHGSTPGYVEAVKFGVEGEIERLKREKNDLIMELMRLRQQQQATEQELQGLGQRIQSMQQRQKQMMTFLVKALQIPDFFAQLLQRNENSIQYGASKKRRLPKQEGEIGAEESQTSEGQLVKFQLGDNGRAHSMFMQLFNHEVSSKDDISASSLVSFFRELTHSSLELLDGNSSVSCSSGITLTEMQASTGLPDALASDFSGQSSLEHSSSPPSFSKLEKMGKTDVTDDLDVVEYLGSGTGNTDSMEVKAESMPLEKSVSEEGAPDNEAASTFVDGSAKVGGSNDGFWEQFLTEKPGSTDAEAEVGMKVPGNGVLEKQEQRPYPNSSWWSSKANVDKLVDQMGQLVSAPKP